MESIMLYDTDLFFRLLSADKFSYLLPCHTLHRRIKVSFASDIRRTQVDDIPVLAPGQRVVMPMEIVLSGLGGEWD